MAKGGQQNSTTKEQRASPVSLDCEMVGVGPKGKKSSLARVVITDKQGDVILDRYVRQKEKVFDYRTHVSGITARDLAGSLAQPFAKVQKEVQATIRNRILIGHGIIRHDLKALGLHHPAHLTRDTSVFPPFMRAVPGGRPQCQALSKLALSELGRTIQTGSHNPAEDAQAAMDLYRLHAQRWEDRVTAGTVQNLSPGE